MAPIDETHRLRILAEIARDEAAGKLKQLGLGPYSIWLIVSMIQLGTRHPAMSPHMRAQLENLGRQLSTTFRGEALTLIEQGWDAAYDVTVGGYQEELPNGDAEGIGLDIDYPFKCRLFWNPGRASGAACLHTNPCEGISTRDIGTVLQWIDNHRKEHPREPAS
jgi:hypothetical protein